MPLRCLPCVVLRNEKKKLLLNEGMRNGEKFSLGNSSLSRLFALSRIYFCLPKIVIQIIRRKQNEMLRHCFVFGEEICFHVSNINVAKCETKKFTIHRDLFTTIQSL